MHKIIATVEPKAKQWLFTLMELLSRDEFALVSVALWSIWHARRKAIHEAIFQTPHATHDFITRYMAELGIVKEKLQQTVVRSVTTGQAHTRPRKPPPGYYKIHVDGGVLGTRVGRRQRYVEMNMGTIWVAQHLSFKDLQIHQL